MTSCASKCLGYPLPRSSKLVHGSLIGSREIALHALRLAFATRNVGFERRTLIVEFGRFCLQTNGFLALSVSLRSQVVTPLLERGDFAHYALIHCGLKTFTFFLEQTQMDVERLLNCVYGHPLLRQYRCCRAKQLRLIITNHRTHCFCGLKQLL